MQETYKLLVVEDELTNSILLKRLLIKEGYDVVVAHNGLDALKLMENEKFDAVLTDWMMPQMDGIELIRKIRENIHPLPLIIMITALVSEGAKAYALDAGADDYIAKPIDVSELLSRVKDGLGRKLQKASPDSYKKITISANDNPPFVSVAIATSTGGPPTLIDVFKNIPSTTQAAFFIVQHGPTWMLETFAQRLQKETGLIVKLAVDGEIAKLGHVYIAPGDMHLRVNPKNYKLILDDGPKENFVKPAADPLFRSVAEAFGKFSIGVILTGLGRDGATGSVQISSVGGKVLIQSPDSAVAPSMPNAAISTKVDHKVFPLNDMGKAISEFVFPLNALLKKA